MDQPALTTDRLRLRPLEVDDAPVFRKLAGDRKVAEGTMVPHPYEEGMAQRYIELTREGWSNGRIAKFAIVRREDGTFLGSTGFTSMDGRHQRAELEYWLGTPYWGNGYATEAASAVVDFGFEDLDLHRVHASHYRSNPGSGRVLEKLGFEQEGVRRQHIQRLGEFRDVVVFGLLREDWEADGPGSSR